jgi:hypothetical protein
MFNHNSHKKAIVKQTRVLHIRIMYVNPQTPIIQIHAHPQVPIIQARANQQVSVIPTHAN